MGLNRPKAEARARDMLYGDPEPATAEPATAEPAAAFRSVDELWQSLQATWESRSTGTELVDALETINDLLDRGVISQDQFGELMARTSTETLAAGQRKAVAAAGRPKERKPKAPARH